MNNQLARNTASSDPFIESKPRNRFKSIATAIFIALIGVVIIFLIVGSVFLPGCGVLYPNVVNAL